MRFLEFTFQSIWHFIGILILLDILINFIIKIFIRKGDRNERDD